MDRHGRARKILTVRLPLATIALEWTRIGCIGFGGPPAHVALLRKLCVQRRGWLSAPEFEDGVAATNLLPGPASTQLAIFCAWRLRGVAGGIVGGLCFIAPGLIAIVALSALFLTARAPLWVAGAAAGAGAAVPAVAVQAAAGLVPASWGRARTALSGRLFWVIYVMAGAAAAIAAGPYLVLTLLACGAVEAARRAYPRTAAPGSALTLVPTAAAAIPLGLVWVAFKVGALSYGGGFVIIPLMQSDAVHVYRWMTSEQFLEAVALGQITPGPVVQTVAVVGYAAAGVGGALLAALVAFAPSFFFVLVGGPRFDQLRRSTLVQSFLAGAGPAAIGAIAGAAIPLARSLSAPWQFAMLAAAAAWLLVLRRGVVSALLGSGVVGAIAALSGAPVVR